MALSITGACINCALCEPLCPTHAIRQGEDYFEIDPGLCNHCVGFNDEPLCALVCPMDCCIPASVDGGTGRLALAKEQG